jgi:hypothetical protein
MAVLEIPSQIAVKNILCATDFSPASTRAFPYALAIAARYGSKLKSGKRLVLLPTHYSTPNAGKT